MRQWPTGKNASKEAEDNIESRHPATSYVAFTYVYMYKYKEP